MSFFYQSESVRWKSLWRHSIWERTTVLSEGVIRGCGRFTRRTWYPISRARRSSARNAWPVRPSLVSASSRIQWAPTWRWSNQEKKREMDLGLMTRRIGCILNDYGVNFSNGSRSNKEKIVSVTRHPVETKRLALRGFLLWIETDRLRRGEQLGELGVPSGCRKRLTGPAFQHRASTVHVWSGPCVS